jgi:hypothetical protein
MTKKLGINGNNMKYINKEEAKNGGTKYHFYVGKEELELLKGILCHYRRTIPCCAETMTIRGRLRNMEIVIKSIKKI